MRIILIERPIASHLIRIYYKTVYASSGNVYARPLKLATLSSYIFFEIEDLTLSLLFLDIT